MAASDFAAVVRGAPNGGPGVSAIRQRTGSVRLSGWVVIKSRRGRILASVVAFAVSFSLLLIVSSSGAQTPSNEASARQNYSEEIRKTYNFLFGKDNFSLPGNAATEDNEFIQAGAFPKAEYCAHCHQEAYAQWRQALHSNSFRAPFYRTSVNILIRTKGIEFSRHCDSCHNPVGVVTGALTTGSSAVR